MRLMLDEALCRAPAWSLHTAHATDEGWRVIEIWDDKPSANLFFAQHVAPHLPAGIRPWRTLQPLHDLVLPVT